jgi:hypothetical protein
MNALPRSLGWFVLVAFGLVASTAVLHWHIAIMVLIASLFGLALAMPRRPLVVSAVLCSPLALLTLTVSTDSSSAGKPDLGWRCLEQLDD